MEMRKEMKNIWSIFRNDLKKIGTNLVAFIVMIGICILPALYAWFNIASNWDPYGNAKNIKIAVVNLDKGSEFGTLKINIGSQVVENLKTNNQKNKNPTKTLLQPPGFSLLICSNY